MQKSRLYQGLSCTVLGLSCLLLTSCTLLKTDYVNHVQATAPQGYGQLQNADSSRVELSDDTSLATSHDGVHNTSVASQLDFYRCYQDEKLNALIDQVLQHNYDLKSAFLTLRQAEVSLGLSRAGLHPTASAGLDASARRNFYNGDSSTRSSGGNLSISYELDLFGRLDVDLAMAADGLYIVRDDLLTEQETLVADVDARAGDHLAHLILRFAAERATRLVEIILVVGHD